MNSLIIYPSQDTPGIQFHPDGKLSISGISIPENVHAFYQEVFNWVEDFGKEHPTEICLNLQLEYMNTSSIKSVIFILNQLIELSKKGAKLTVNWMCDSDDDELIEEGELLQECVNFPFNFVFS